jgi:hypothetical protein
MRRVSGFVDGLLVELNIPESQHELHTLVRAEALPLSEAEGYVYDYTCPETITLERPPTTHGSRLLFILETNPPVEEKAVVKQGVVLQHLVVDKFQRSTVSTEQAKYKLAIELREDFCQKHNLGQGSVISIYDELRESEDAED